MFDAVIVPGGGLTPTGDVPPWVAARLDRAVQRSAGCPILCLSAATVHKPPPLDATGRPVLEAVADARHLVERGVEAARIFLEFASYDTIGNAFFSRILHTDLLEWRRLLVVNSAFHMERTEAVFRWVFGLAPDPGYELAFDTVEDVGMAPRDLEFRAKREASSMEKLRLLTPRIRTVRELHRFLFTEHEAYTIGGWLRPRPRSEELERVY